MNSFSPRTFILVLLLAALGARCSDSGPRDDLLRLTGARTKIVWSQQAEGDARDVFARGEQLILMGLDTAERRGARALSAKPGNYHRPLITPDGSRVVFSDWNRSLIFAVNWKDGVLRQLTGGIALTVWRDPVTQRDWVYALEAITSSNGAIGGPLFRFPLDDPGRREAVWGGSELSVDSFRISADGRRAGGLLPGPHAGILNLEKKTRRLYGRGCWTGFSPDNEYLLWVFDGPHRNLLFHSEDGKTRWQTAINGIPDGGGYEVYHPRWSNHRRFFALSGPYRQGTGSNRIGDGGKEVEVFLGRFSDDLTSVEQWVQITRNKRLDIAPDVWIEGAMTAASRTRPSGPSTETAGAAASPTGGVIAVRGKLVTKSTTPSPRDIAPYRHALVVYLYELDRAVPGLPANRRVGVAHWAMRDAAPLPLRRTTGETYDLKLERFSARPELEGERVVMDFEQGEWPLYFAVE
jgi:hypothetical protein